MPAKTVTLCTIGLFVLTAIAGCSSSEKPMPSPSAATTASVAPRTSSPAPAPQAPALVPAVLYNKTLPFSIEAAPAFTNLSVAQPYDHLTIQYFLNATSGCYTLSSEPPQGLSTGAAPRLTVKPPMGDAITFDLPSGPGSCGTGPGFVVKQDAKTVANLVGDWSFAVTGRGQNLNLQIVARAT